jgi:hypothetical protein
METFAGYVEQYKPVLVVVDNLRTAFREVDHDKNSAMVNVIAGLLDLKNEKGFALVVAHHTKKNTSGYPYPFRLAEWCRSYFGPV